MPYDGKTARGRTYKRLTLAEKLWPKVNRNGRVVRPELGPCWLWQGSTTSGPGYGYIKHEGKALTVHLTSWLLAGNERPGDGSELCHKCDVRNCVNPSHLFIGTRSDNMRDAATKGRLVQQHAPHRMRRGSAHHSAKLEENKVRAIRAAAARGETLLSLAQRFGVSDTLIGYIVRRRIWKHVE